MATEMVHTTKHVIWQRKLLFCCDGGSTKFGRIPSGGFKPGHVGPKNGGLRHSAMVMKIIENFDTSTCGHYRI